MNATLTNAAAVPIDPNFIVSVSTPGIALMDYKAVGSDELPVIKGDLVRVYKRYNQCVSSVFVRIKCFANAISYFAYSWSYVRIFAVSIAC